MSDAPHDQIGDHARDISAKAEGIDALLLGVEVMIQDQRRLMRDEKAGSFLLDNELWGGIAGLLTMARHEALTIGEKGDAIQHAMMPAPAGASAS
jgi:hypothetical protein